jgi:hypothetical protein
LNGLKLNIEPIKMDREEEAHTVINRGHNLHTWKKQARSLVGRGPIDSPRLSLSGKHRLTEGEGDAIEIEGKKGKRGMVTKAQQSKNMAEAVEQPRPNK